MKSILGISAFYHDSAAALIKDGNIIAAAQEERFSRIKHDAKFPKSAIAYVLKESNLKLSEIDHIVFFEKPYLKFERLIKTYLAFAPKGFQSFSTSIPIWLKEKLFQKKYLFNQLKAQDQNFNDIKKIEFSWTHFSSFRRFFTFVIQCFRYFRYIGVPSITGGTIPCRYFSRFHRW